MYCRYLCLVCLSRRQKEHGGNVVANHGEISPDYTSLSPGRQRCPWTQKHRRYGVKRETETISWRIKLVTEQYEELGTIDRQGCKWLHWNGVAARFGRIPWLHGGREESHSVSCMDPLAGLLYRGGSLPASGSQHFTSLLISGNKHWTFIKINTDPIRRTSDRSRPSKGNVAFIFKLEEETKQNPRRLLLLLSRTLIILQP